MSGVIQPAYEIAAMIAEAGGADLAACYQCGACTASCPLNLVGELGVRHLIRLASIGEEGFDGSEIWRCTSCRTCVSRCPRGVDIIEIQQAVRRLLAQASQMPAALRAVVARSADVGNPWGGEIAARAAWSADLGLPHVREVEERTLLFTCCTPAYDPRTRRTARALAVLLRAAGIRFGDLDGAERCCGDPAHRLGGHEVATRLRQHNAALMREHRVRRVITSSPHCALALADAVEAEVLHYTEMLAPALARGELRLARSLPLKVAYHDPCYLGRHRGVYEQPRALLGGIRDLELVELAHCREDALCCGGGGGGAFRDVAAGERIAALRVDEAMAAGVRIIATACPFCVLMLEDALKSKGLDETLDVFDVAELLAAAL